MSGIPHITFGIIVLNGEPFTRYNLRALYPFAHEIIVVEGASPLAAHMATSDGHSIDGTLDILYRFKIEEDPQDKIIIVTAEDEGHPNGFWPGEKDEQSQAYAKRATGDWLWQIDIDEFYHPEDMQRVCQYLQAHPEVTCLTFNAYHFWGGFDYLVEGGLFMSRSFQGEPWGAFRRVFKWGPGYQYVSHRPPTVRDVAGRDLSERARNVSRSLKPNGVYMYHYFMIFADQVLRKGRYYDNQGWRHEDEVEKRYGRLFTQLEDTDRFRIFTHWETYNWLRRFTGSHPPAIDQLRHDLLCNRLPFAQRKVDDIETILRTPGYEQQIAWLRRWEWLKAANLLCLAMLKVYLKQSVFSAIPVRLRTTILEQVRK